MTRPATWLPALLWMLMAASPPGGRAAAGDRFEEVILPLLERYCIECHMEGFAEGGLAFDTIADEASALEAGHDWVRVLDAVEGRLMPPPRKKQPTEEERAALIGWIEEDYLASRRDARPGPVIIRRLNRQEYDNTIRDLVGLDLGLSRDFPPDDSGFGFDNVGSALNVSPAHIEKYLEAAERAVGAAIPTPDADGFAPIELIGLRTYPLPRDEAVEFDHTLKPGRYLADFSLVRVGVPETAPAPRIEVAFGKDGRALDSARIQDETLVYRFWIDVFEGDWKVRVALAREQDPAALTPVEGSLAEAGGDQRYGSNKGLHVDSMVVYGPVKSVEGGAMLGEEPGPGDEARAAAARGAIGRFAERAFRRPLRAGELDELMAVFGAAQRRGESFELSVQLPMMVALASPRFLYLIEPGESGEDRPLDDFELASRLSYFLWSSMPDEELFRLARVGALRPNLDAQVDRMLEDPKAEALVTNFAGQWLQLRKLAASTPDPGLFPGFDDGLRQAMREESERYIGHVLREDRSVLELIDSDYTFLNESLAKHYGVGGVEGDEFRRVALSDRRRGGVMTQASVLTLTSNPNRTSPVKRGQWILQQILGTPPPPPPPDVPELDESEHAAGAASLRDRLEQHRANPACASCHSQMDPIGFALENYDAVGRWRETDGEFPVEPAGELAGGLAFEDAGALKAVLADAASKQFTRSLIENMMTYALGRGLGPDDFPAVEEIRKDLMAKDYRARAIMHGIVRSRAFQNRGESR